MNRDTLTIAFDDDANSDTETDTDLDSETESESDSETDTDTDTDSDTDTDASVNKRRTRVMGPMQKFKQLGMDLDQWYKASWPGADRDVRAARVNTFRDEINILYDGGEGYVDSPGTLRVSKVDGRITGFTCWPSGVGHKLIVTNEKFD